MADGVLVTTWTETIQPGEKTYVTPITEEQAAEIVSGAVPGAVAAALAEDDTVAQAAQTAAGTALAAAGGIGTKQLAEQAVTTQKLKFADTGKNLLDPRSVTQGVTLAANGTTSVSAPLAVSGYIPVAPGDVVTFSASDLSNLGPRSIAWYTAAQQFISFQDNATYATITATAPATAAYVRAAYRITSLPTAQVEKAPAKTAFEAYRMLLPTAQLTPANFGPGSITDAALGLGAVKPEKAGFVTTGKNLYDPARATSGYYVSEATGALVALAGFFTSDFIPVKAGLSYSFAPSRKIAWYDNNRTFLAGSNHADETNAHTVAAPADGFVRFSYRNSATAQAEQGPPTGFEAYRITIPALALLDGQGSQAGAVVVTRTGTALAITSRLRDGSAVTIGADLAGSANGAFNLTSASRDGTPIHAATDDIAPIRTTTATVGANHGYTCIGRYTVAGHTKTAADLGSVWTDGARQYVLLAISGNDLTVGGSYTTNGDGTTVAAPVAPAGQLTHVSGATSTAAIPIATPVTGAQLYPSVKNVSVAVIVDDAPLTGNGSRGGSCVQVTETYDVLDYAALYEWAKANVGQSYAANLSAIAGLVRISNVYRFTQQGRCLVAATLTALAKTALGVCGFIQSVPLTPGAGQVVTRYLPGVKPKSGISFADPTDLTAYAQTLTYSPADWLSAALPPVRCVDWLTAGGAKVVGFTHGYLPKLDAADTVRDDLASAWEIRDTKKSYPAAVGPVVLDVGDTRSVEGYRIYLAPPPEGLSAADQITDGEATWIHADRHTVGTSHAPGGIVGAPAAVARTQGMALGDTHVTAAGVRTSGVGSITVKV